jgi:hypothetical protein
VEQSIASDIENASVAFTREVPFSYRIPKTRLNILLTRIELR